jgi:hypothetical protein
MSACDPKQTNWLAFRGSRNSLPLRDPLSASEQTIEEAEPRGDRHSLERVLPDIIFRGVHYLDGAILRAPGLPLGDIANCRGDKDRWCRNPITLDASGVSVFPTNPGAMKRCSRRALIAAAYELTHDHDAADHLAYEALRPQCATSALIYINDTAGHAAPSLFLALSKTPSRAKPVSCEMSSRQRTIKGARFHSAWVTLRRVWLSL